MAKDNWVNIAKEIGKTEFIGYTELSSTATIKAILVNGELAKTAIAGNKVQIVLDRTPFYAESGGQVGDTGFIESANEKIIIIDTKKENDLTVHYAEKLAENLSTAFIAKVDKHKRQLSMDNHSATHLLHAALRQVLGKHVEQKGSCPWS